MSTTPYIDLEALTATVAAVKENPNLGLVTFALEGRTAGGLRINSQTGALTQAGEKDESRRGKFKLQSDEPVSLLGSDQAVSPAEYILKGLAGCYAVTLTALAAQEGIKLESVEVELAFDINLSGFLGIDKSVRVGAQQIRVDVSIDSPGTPRSTLEGLIRKLQETSPIRDTIANPVDVVTTLK